MTKEPPEIKIVENEVKDVGCDGGAKTLGHPLIYLPFEGRDNVQCYYCGQRFYKKSSQETLYDSTKD